MISFFAVSSKYIFQFRGKHLFNPANFGLVFMMLFTNQAFITNHRADHILIGFFVLGSLAILYLTNRRKLDVIVVFIFFSLLARGFVSSIGMDSALLYAQEVWYLIYVFLLIADPLSNPNSRIGRMSWVFIIVLSTQIFVYGLGVQYGHFYALAVAGLFMPLIDYVCKKEAVFSWDSVYKRELHSNAVLPS
jgi:Na+-transporting NADH:ubiquinone oxidoreductase subunit NqrB